MRDHGSAGMKRRPLPFFLKRTPEGVVLAVFSCACCGKGYPVHDPAGRQISHYCFECDVAYQHFRKTLLERAGAAC
jgi:hypothetical protein